MMNGTDCVQFFSAMLTPTIAMITTYIAVQQYRLQRLTSKRELYDRRLQVFEATMEFVAKVVRDGSPDDDGVRQLSRQRAASLFLFKEEIPKYLDELYKKAVDLMFADRELDSSALAPGKRRDEVIEKRTVLFDWFSDQLEGGVKKFQPYLSVS